MDEPDPTPQPHDDAPTDPLGLSLPLPAEAGEDGEPAHCLRLPNGNLRIVLEPRDPELATGWLEIGPEHPGYRAWLPYAEEGGAAQ